MEFDFEKSLKICLTAMRIIRTHPDIHLDPKWLLQIGMCFGSFTLLACIMIQNAYSNFIENNFSEACQNGILCFTYFGSSLNIFIMIYHRKPIKHILDLMRNDFLIAQKLPLNEQKILHKFVDMQIDLCKKWFIVCSLSLGIFNGKAMVLMLYHYLNDDPKLVNLYEMKFPDIIEERKNNIVVFCVIYASLFMFGAYACLTYLSFIPFGPLLMLHASGHLEVTKTHIDTLFDGDVKDVNERLNEIVRRMEYVYNLVETVKDRFKSYYEAVLTLSSFLLPVTFYELLKSIGRGELSLEFSSFLVSGLLVSSTQCYFSEMLLEKGKEVSLALYTCGWERHYDRRVRTTILVLLMRSARPLALRTMFSTLCLVGLTDMFEQAYRIFSLMNAVLD